MRAEIISIGTELLLGHGIDTDSAFVGLALAEAGIPCRRKSCLADDQALIAEGIRAALGRSELLVLIGGLGPTVDDLTREALAEACGLPLEEDSELLAGLQALFARLGRPMSPNNRRQALKPRGAVAIPNPMGTAPGLWLVWQGRQVCCLPGPPRELEPMVLGPVKQRLQALAGAGSIATRRLMLFGLSESAVDQAVRDLFDLEGNPSVSILARLTEVELRVTARAEDERAAKQLAEGKVRALLGRLKGHCYSEEGEAMQQKVVALLKERGLTLALAESCTGGLIASRITSVPGASAVLKQGLVTYSDESKVKLLKVPSAVLERSGAVSKECSLAMAVGLARESGCDLNLAVTGIAGPDGGSPEKPVGLVHFALAHHGGVWHQEYRFGPAPRPAIQARAGQAGLWLILQALEGERPPELGQDRGVPEGA